MLYIDWQYNWSQQKIRILCVQTWLFCLCLNDSLEFMFKVAALYIILYYLISNCIHSSMYDRSKPLYHVIRSDHILHCWALYIIIIQTPTLWISSFMLFFSEAWSTLIQWINNCFSVIISVHLICSQNQIILKIGVLLDFGDYDIFGTLSIRLRQNESW